MREQGLKRILSNRSLSPYRFYVFQSIPFMTTFREHYELECRCCEKLIKPKEFAHPGHPSEPRRPHSPSVEELSTIAWGPKAALEELLYKRTPVETPGVAKSCSTYRRACSCS